MKACGEGHKLASVASTGPISPWESLGRKADGNPAKLWLTVSQPPERRRRAALACKILQDQAPCSLVSGGNPSCHAYRSCFSKRSRPTAAPHFDHNETWMLIHGKQDCEWRGCGIAFLTVLGHHESSSLHKAATCTILRDRRSKPLGAMSRTGSALPKLLRRCRIGGHPQLTTATESY